jgi:hypothetical protein
MRIVWLLAMIACLVFCRPILLDAPVLLLALSLNVARHRADFYGRAGLIDPRRLMAAVHFRTVKFVGGQNDPLRSHNSFRFSFLRSISYLLK